MSPFSESLFSSLLISLQIALGGLCWIIVPGVAAGWFLSRKRFPGKNILESLINMPLFLPPVVTGVLLLTLLGKHGWVGEWLWKCFGITLAFDYNGAVIAAGIMGMPVLVRAARTSFDHADPKLDEAASVFGMGPFKRFVFLTMPLSLPGITGGLFMALGRMLGEFGATLLFCGNIEGETRTLSMAIYTYLQIPGKDFEAMMIVLAAIFLTFFIVWISNTLCSGGRIFRHYGRTL